MSIITRLQKAPFGVLPLVAALALSACAGSGGPEATAMAPATGVPAQADGAETLQQRVGTLPPQTLEDGACGMFLWARGSRANLVFFTSDTTNQAHIVFDGEEMDLPRTVADGQFVFGQYTKQQFAGDALNLRLSVQPDAQSRLIGGAVVRHGTLSVEGKDGWSLVLPVAGMIACKST